MWRMVFALTLLLTLALGAVAEAKCQVCVESAKVEKVDSGMALRFTARAVHGATLPETGTAVVMQVDGNRSKCINVSLRKIDESAGLATYAGTLTWFYGNSTFTGRVDIGGDIHEFATPLDGTPGSLQLVTAASAGQVASSATTAPTAAPTTPVTAAATTVPAATAAAATAAAQVASAPAIPSPAEHPVAWLGLVVILATLAGAFIDRRRSLARAATA